MSPLAAVLAGGVFTTTPPGKPLGQRLCMQTVRGMQVQSFNLRAAKENVLGEGNGTPLQYSCLENPMDGGAW